MIYRGPGFLVSCSLMIRPLAHPLPPSLVSKSFSFFPSVAGRAYWWEREGVGEEPIIRLRESLALYKSFITLCRLQLPKPSHGHPISLLNCYVLMSTSRIFLGFRVWTSQEAEGLHSILCGTWEAVDKFPKLMKSRKLEKGCFYSLRYMGSSK